MRDSDLVSSERHGRVLFVLGVSTAFAICGVMAAAYSAHLFLHCLPVTLLCPSTALPTAGPAWLTSGGVLGLVVGTSVTLGLIHLVRWMHRSPGRPSESG